MDELVADFSAVDCFESRNEFFEFPFATVGFTRVGKAFEHFYADVEGPLHVLGRNFVVVKFETSGDPDWDCVLVEGGVQAQGVQIGQYAA